MFKKILIANRGEIAVRILHACRELSIPCVAVYEAEDMTSLHVRLADECVRLSSPNGFNDIQAILHLAQETRSDAIHPGYGFLSEQPAFAKACQEAGIALISPPLEGLEIARCKLEALRSVREAGIQTVEFSQDAYCEDECSEALRREAGRLGYPIVVKPGSGGRGSGERLVRRPSDLAEAVRLAQFEAQTLLGDRRVYLEKAIFPAYHIGVQILGDHEGGLVHLGEHQDVLLPGNRKLISESPAPCLTQPQREHLWNLAIEIARLFHYRSAGTVEFLMDEAGRFHFTEIKARILVEHPLAEMVSHVDLVKEQIRIAAGEPLTLLQDDIHLSGWAMLCRVNAEDPWSRYLPSPGHLQWVRPPSGPHVRVDTFAYSGCEISPRYDPLIAKVTVWDEDRLACLERMRRALDEFKLSGVAANLSQLTEILLAKEFERGSYHTQLRVPFGHDRLNEDAHRQRLAVAAALIYLRRNQPVEAEIPPRLFSGWHRSSRRVG